MNETCVEEVTVGVALDGFPIKISKKCHTNADVDECGGMTDENGDYAYYFTDEWPYSLRCFKAGFRKNTSARLALVLLCLDTTNSALSA